MTSLDDKAAESPDVDLARHSAPGMYRLVTRDLESADDITPEGEFPQFGDFLLVETTTGGSEPRWDGEQYIECPADLARQLVGQEVEVGDAFHIRSNRKVDGEWEYEIEARPEAADEIAETDD